LECSIAPNTIGFFLARLEDVDSSNRPIVTVRSITERRRSENPDPPPPRAAVPRWMMVAEAFAVLERAAESTRQLRRSHAGIQLRFRGLRRPDSTLPHPPSLPATRRLVRLPPSEVDPVILAAERIHTGSAFDFMDRLIEAKDPVTGLLPAHVRTERGRLIAADHVASAAEMGRQTIGLVMAARLARATGDRARADTYLAAAIANYGRGREILMDGDRFIHRRDFDDAGQPKWTEIGEPGRSLPGEDNMTRVNARAHAISAAGELYRETGEEKYLLDFERTFRAWVVDFHDVDGKGFFIHANVSNPHDHKELASVHDPGGKISKYDGSAGMKGFDGTIDVMASVLIRASQILATDQTRALVKEQLDLILDTFRRQNGMLWEEYTRSFSPIAERWHARSHIAIGGHTAMATRQVIEGARQLWAHEAIQDDEYRTYVKRAVELFQEFASNSGAIDWNTGVIHSAIRLEEPVERARHVREWCDSSWQQAELIQTLLCFREEGRLGEIVGPDCTTGEDLLRLAELHFAKNCALPAEYEFLDEAPNPDVFHRPALALHHHQLSARFYDEVRFSAGS
jgi:hypothetical protein